MSDKRTNLFEVAWNIVAFAFRQCNLLERSGKLSLTNLAVMVCVVKIAVAPVISIPEIGALLLSLLNYGHKRYESNKAAKAELIAQAAKDTEQSKEIKANQEAIKQLTEQVQAQAKVVEEAKSIMTAQKLQAGIKRQQL